MPEFSVISVGICISCSVQILLFLLQNAARIRRIITRIIFGETRPPDTPRNLAPLAQVVHSPPTPKILPPSQIPIENPVA